MQETVPTTLYERIKNEIIADIAAGKLKAGERAPSERALAERSGVSRITAKRALADLIAEGVLARLPRRKGAFVRSSTGGKVPRLIAVAIDDVRGSFGSNMLRGIEDYFWDRRIHTLICNADRDFDKVEEYFRSLLASGVSGVIFAPVIDVGYVQRNRALIAILERAGIPYTLIDRYIPGLLANYAVANHEESSRYLTERLFEKGYERILLVRGLECTSMDDREAGYRHAHADASRTVDERLIVRVNENILNRGPGGEEDRRLARLSREAGRFDCVFALNDGLLRGAVRVLRDMGLPIGGVIGAATHGELDSPPLPELASAPHFVEPSYEMGWEAAKILVDYIMDPGKAIVQKVLKSRFVPGAAGYDAAGHGAAGHGA